MRYRPVAEFLYMETPEVENVHYTSEYVELTDWNHEVCNKLAEERKQALPVVFSNTILLRLLHKLEKFQFKSFHLILL